MMKEIAAAIFFLKRLVKRSNKLASEKVDLFVERLAVALQEKFKGHWYPDNPSKGQAYRCIRINRFHRHDPELLRACQESGIQYSELGLPREFTLWVDPGEVCCRYGEQNPCFSVATLSSAEEDDKDVAKKVASALERVTSDYYSGSSSDEECSRNSPLTIPNRHSDAQAINSAQWHPKRTGPGRGHIFTRQQSSFRPRNKPMQLLRQNVWVPPGHRKGPVYWATQQSCQQYYS